MVMRRFEQDPTQPFGVGNFTDDQGRTTYANDPTTAKSLQPSLADQVSAQSTAAATAVVGAQETVPDARLASNDGATGSAAVGQSPAAQLVGKLDRVGGAPNMSMSPPNMSVGVPAAPSAAVPERSGAGATLVSKLDQMPVLKSTSSTTVQRGRDAGKVEKEIGDLHEADTGIDEQLRTNAEHAEDRGKKAAEGEKSLALSEYARSYQSAQEQRLRAERIEDEVRKLSGEKDTPINPNRLLDNMSTGKEIGMVILAAISGAFGNTNGQGQNTFLSAIDKRIDQDVKAQRDQIASGRLRRNNMISWLQSQGADAHQAQIAYESRVYGAAADWARAKIKSLGIQGAALDHANMQIAQLDQQRAARDAELRQSTESKYATTTNIMRTDPSLAGVGGAGGSGGADALKKFQQKLAARSAYEKAGATPEQLQEFDRAFGVPSPEGESEAARKAAEDAGKQSAEEGKAQAASTAIENFGIKAGLVRDPRTGQWKVSDSGYVPPGFVESINPFDDNSIEAAGNAAVEAYGRLQSGGVIGDDERESFRDQIGMNTGNRIQLAARLNAAEKTIQSRLPRASRDQGRPTPKGRPIGKVGGR